VPQPGMHALAPFPRARAQPAARPGLRRSRAVAAAARSSRT
jgi:hypothetical protein